jgi:galactonate dehydratase
MPHNPLGPICTAATLHLAAAVPNFAWLEVWVNLQGETATWTMSCSRCARASKARVSRCPKRPAWGWSSTKSWRVKQPFKFWEAPHLHPAGGVRRRDGSYTELVARAVRKRRRQFGAGGG